MLTTLNHMLNNFTIISMIVLKNQLSNKTIISIIIQLDK